MRFTDREIALATQLKQHGLPWTPRPGHYVHDPESLIEAPSPFQDRVYFILDLKHFLRRSGTIERLTQSMVWLPDWKQTRSLLSDHGLNDHEVGQHLFHQSAYTGGDELACLYELLLNRLHS